MAGPCRACAVSYTQIPLMKAPAYVGLQLLQRALPKRALSALTKGYCDAMMAYWRLVTKELVAAVAEAGGELYAWTVDEPEQIRALTKLGVHGVITNDPLLFES